MRIINKRIVLHVKDATEDDKIKLKENGYVYFEDDILNNQMFEKEEGSDIAIINMSAGCGCCDAHVRIYNCPSHILANTETMKAIVQFAIMAQI